MSEDKIKRRRFLADILFAGGAITAAALLAQASRDSAVTSPSATPAELQTPEVMVKGEMVLPQATPSPLKTEIEEPHVKGKVAFPQSLPKKKP